jgi:DMSO/TMAO reductase YedYZ molybdopterin-dependent catalytic subunit
MKLLGVGGASAMLSTLSLQAQAQTQRIFAKDDAKLLNIGATVRSAKWWEFSTYITPVDRFFIRSRYPVPTVDLKAWRLKVHGDGVSRPLELTYDDLLKLPSRRAIRYLECNGNGRTMFWEQLNMMNVRGGNWGLGAVSQGEWEYIPIGEILDRAGLKPEAREVLFWSGIDGPDTGRPLPIGEVLNRPEEIGIAFAMNGDPLTPDHGFPARALVPGWGGAASTKWITEIKVSTNRFWVRMNTREEADIGPDYPVERPGPNDEFRAATPEDIKGIMARRQNVKSFLTLPLTLQKSRPPANYPLAAGERPKISAGQQVMRGYAHSPFGIRQVMYRIDGNAWLPATIVPPNLGGVSWVRFEFTWQASRGVHVLETRATDRAGNTQPFVVPFNELGHMNNVVPRFEVEVV